VKAATDGVGLHAEADEIVGAEMVERLFAAYRHTF
jgi:hypothetical protein